MSSVGASKPLGSLPAIAVLHDLGSASLSTILAAAARKYHVVFVIDRDLPFAAEEMSQANRAADIIDVTTLSWEARVGALRQLQLSGVMTFSEYRLADASAMATELGLPGHSPETVTALTDKFIQRQVLSDRGVQSTRCIRLALGASNVAPDFPFPAILKPSRGAGSLHTSLIEDPGALEAAMSSAPAATDFVLEEYLRGDPTAAGHGFGDYVSVESVHSGGQSNQVCVTGKLPFAHPFRETGMFLPCTLEQPMVERILELEAAAIKAIGVEHGVTHTEIKLTANGPRIIEVNGRLGGYVPEILKRATGINLVQAALAASIGLALPLPRYQTDCVTYQVFLTPAAQCSGTLAGFEGLDAIEAIDGVLQVDMRSAVGDSISTDGGTQSLLGIVYGSASDHEGLRSSIDTIHATFRPRFM